MKMKEYSELMENTTLADKVHDIQQENYKLKMQLLDIEKFCLKQINSVDDIEWITCLTKTKFQGEI